MAPSVAKFILYSLTLRFSWIASVPVKPTDVEIDVNLKALTVNVSWKVPTTDMKVKYTSITLYDSQKCGLYADGIDMPTTYYLVKKGIHRCMQYTVSLITRFGNGWSGHSYHKFDMFDTYTATIGSNTSIAWLTHSNGDYRINSPKGIYLYQINADGRYKAEIKGNKYTLDLNVSGEITLGILDVGKDDAGLYTTKNIVNECTNEVNGCAMLIVTDIPSKPELSVSPRHGFVGDSLKFTCRSSIRRWPYDGQSSLSYTYFGINGTRVGNDLVVKNVQKDHEGVEVRCIAKDNHQQTSEYSNTITLNPYYGPDDIQITPYVRVVEISEGKTLGPYNCTADCNPPCSVRWRTNIWGDANITFPASTLRIPDIARNQKGVYTCDVFHQHDRSRQKHISITVNVLYTSKPCNSFTDNTEPKSNVSNIPLIAAMSAGLVLLLVVIVVIVIKLHLEKKKNQQAPQRQSSVEQSSQDRDDSHYINADFQGSVSDSFGCYLSLRRRDESHAYGEMRQDIPEGNDERVYTDVE